MKKHAYLIMCHNNLEQIKKLLLLLDDERNDIYIHIDKKMKFNNFNEISDVLQYSRIFFVKRINVNWGGFSQIKAELILLEEAVKNEYLYYHLISGSDLPIKKQKEIHNFFDIHVGENFISIEESSEFGYNAYPRIGQYHFLQDKIGRNKGKIISICEKIENFSLKLQKMLKINRLSQMPTIYKGSNWFSITHQMATLVLAKRKRIEKYFKFGIAADELFLQTIAMESSIAYTINSDYKRLIDWNRGNPYIWKLGDFNELISSKNFWARKFDITLDDEIIEEIYNYIKN